jgi:3-isopropylmalate/(R)-2-methylmalate dehydratase small subunit
MTEPFKNFTGVGVAMPAANINTDAIIPSPYLRTASADMGKGLFGQQRYNDSGAENPGFILNRQPFRSATILFAGENFGCGSSREAAVWALKQFGIKCVLAPSFADIFYENAFRNGVLAARLDKTGMSALFDLAGENATQPYFEIDLLAGTVTHTGGYHANFHIAPSRRDALIRGDDEISITMQYWDEIAAFHSAGLVKTPWLHAPLVSRIAS